MSITFREPRTPEAADQRPKSVLTAKHETASEQAGIPTLQIKPQMVKSAVTGSGTASKQAVKKRVNKILDATLTNGHEADAAAAAIAGLLQPMFHYR